jgi:hypothetical protein
MRAVEWLEDCLTEQHPNGSFVWNTRADLEALFKQAKEIENQQQGYSEEEVIKILYQFHYDLVNSNFDTKEEWFEQFKKK